MRTCYKALSWVILAVVLAAVAWPTDVAADEDKPEFHYYSKREGRLPLTLSTEMVGIKFEEGLSEAEQASIVAAESNLGPFDERLELDILTRKGMTVIPVKEGASATAVLAAIEKLNASAAVEFATPVFEVFPGKNELLTDEFYASFPAGVSERDILALNAKHHVEVIRKKERRFIDRIGYSLRVTPESGINALDMANLYFENTLTVASTPSTIHLYSLVATNDDYYNDQWHLPQIDAPEAWVTSTGSSSITIAIIDSGVDLDHIDLVGKIVDGRNIVADPDNNDPDDDFGHGTCCAGIAAADTDNDEGVAGVDWNAKIMPVKVLNLLGFGTASDCADGIDWAADNGADILSNSWGGALPHAEIEDAVEDARAAGCVIVASAGNDNANWVLYPAAYPEVIAVGATNANDQRCNPDDWPPPPPGEHGSNYGEEVDVAAPGVDICTTDWAGDDGFDDLDDEDDEDYFFEFRGTSAPTPQVSGLAGLVLALESDLTPAQVQAVIQFSADDCEYIRGNEEAEAGRDEYTGYGRIDADEALDLAQAERFVISDSNGDHLASFDDQGNFVLEGDLTENATAEQLNPTAGKEFIIRDGNGDEVARIDGDGDLYIAGELTEGDDSPDPGASNPAFIVTDSSSNIVAYIDSDGDLVLKGRAFIGGDPDRSSSQGT